MAAAAERLLGRHLADRPRLRLREQPGALGVGGDVLRVLGQRLADAVEVDAHKVAQRQHVAPVEQLHHVRLALRAGRAVLRVCRVGAQERRDHL